MDSYINLIEEISLNAWPAHKIQLYDGWLLRFSHNYTHRTNCVSIINQGTLPLEEKVSFCENEYKKFKSPTIFKISPLLPDSFDSYLNSLGYQVSHTTEVMTMPLSRFSPLPYLSKSYEGLQDNKTLPSFVTYSNNTLVQLSDTITQDWITNLFRLNRTTNPTHLRIVPSMFQAIPKETIVANIEIDGRMVASGLGILDREHIGLYAIYVDASCRNKQFGKAICSTIINEGMKKGAKSAYLQVVSDNEIAKKLYQSLGFEYKYTYWFRIKD